MFDLQLVIGQVVIGGQHELQVLGRLFQRLEQGVEGVLGELVRLVNHEDLEAADRGLVGCPLDQLADLVDAAVGGRVQLHIVDVAVGVDFAAGGAHPARVGGDAPLPIGAGAVQALGQDARNGRLADAARAGEQVGMVQALLFEGVGQRADDVLLPDQRFE